MTLSIDRLLEIQIIKKAFINVDCQKIKDDLVFMFNKLSLGFPDEIWRQLNFTHLLYTKKMHVFLHTFFDSFCYEIEVYSLLKINRFAFLLLMVFAYSNVQAIIKIRLKEGCPSVYRGLDNLEWKEALINRGEIFLVFLAKFNGKTLIKPANNGYTLYEYEELFGFGPKCSNFDLQKIIDITSIIKDEVY